MRVSIESVSVVGGQRPGYDSPAIYASGGRSHSRRGTLELHAASGKRCGVAIAESGGRFRLRSNKGRLAALAEPDLPGGIEAGTIAADLVAEEYGSDPSHSIVTSLRHALEAAHRQLCKENLNSLSSDRRSVALGCAVVRDQDVYLAQVGPTLGIRLRDGELSLIGQEFTPGAIPFASCLGQDCTIEPHFSRESLQPGDAIVICTPGLIRIGVESELAECMGRGGAARVAESLFNLQQTSLTPADFTALVIAVEADGTSGRTVDRSNGRVPQWIEGQEEESLRPSRRRRTSKEPDKVDGRASARSRRRGSDFELPPRQDSHSIDPPSPGSAPLRRRRGLDGSSRRIDLKRITMFAIVPLIVIAALSACGLLLVRALSPTNGQGGPTIASIDEKEQQAQAAQDLTTKRRLLSQADELAVQASSARPGDQSLAASHERISGELNQLTNSIGLPAARKLIDLGQPTGATDASKMVVAGGDLYILDAVADNIRRYQLDQSGDQLQASQGQASQGQIIASRTGSAAVGQIVGMAWVPAGGERERSAIVFANDAGQIFQYDPASGLAALRGPPHSWTGSVQAMGGYAGALYVLSPKEQKLVWYQPTAQGYEKAAYNYIDPDLHVGLSDAVDFAVDSSLYLLHSAGKIDRFIGGKLQPFDSSTPDVPLRDPTAIYASSSAASVYVVDAGNQRIVEYTRDGHFERQFRYGGSDNQFKNVVGINVDERLKKIYILADSKVFVADLPKQN